jgi:hypothetical protein
MIYLDFEYNQSNEIHMGLVCASVLNSKNNYKRSFWLYEGGGCEKDELKRFIEENKEEVFVGYAIDLAEARCFVALGFDPTKFNWRDLNKEWVWLRNHTDEFLYGWKIRRNSDTKYHRVWHVKPLKSVRKRHTEDEKEEIEKENEEFRAEVEEEIDEDVILKHRDSSGLLDALVFFELLKEGDIHRAKTIKDRMRELILANENLLKHKAEILAYCESDISSMHDLQTILSRHITDLVDSQTTYINEKCYDITAKDVVLNIGNWTARQAVYSSRGVPIHKGRLENLVKYATEIIDEEKIRWNDEHPNEQIYEVANKKRLRKGGKRLGEVVDERVIITEKEALLNAMIQNIVLATGNNWIKTKKGKFTTSKEELKKHQEIPLVKDLIEHKGVLSVFKGFYKENSRAELLGSIGKDNRQRYMANTYGALTGRSQPKATTFLFLKGKWTRLLMDPPQGYSLIELDYGSQEVFIAAALSNDDAYLEAYKSNDFYMSFAKQAGLYNDKIPTSQEREEEWFKPYVVLRETVKALCLSVQYGAGAESLARTIRVITKDNSYTEEQAQDLLDAFKITFSTYCSWRDKLGRDYRAGKNIMLWDGWLLGKDCPTFLTTLNFPIQGTATCILREACRLCDEANLEILATIHDAILFLAKTEEAQIVADKARDLMVLASLRVLGIEGMKVGKPEIIDHGVYWIHGGNSKKIYEKYKGKLW